MAGKVWKCSNEFDLSHVARKFYGMFIKLFCTQKAVKTLVSMEYTTSFTYFM